MAETQEGRDPATKTQVGFPKVSNEKNPMVPVPGDDIHLAHMLNGARWCIEAAFGEIKEDLLEDTGASDVPHLKVQDITITDFWC